MNGDTIAAVATPPGRGGVGIIRVSGPKAPRIAEAVTGLKLSPRVATYCDFVESSGAIVDQGIALFFPNPASFTGEDVLELQGHGGPVVLSLLLAQVVQLGARIARPGEFSERAFLNDKLDLSQAEAVADLIDSTTEAAARSALRSLKGVFSDQVKLLDTSIVQLRMFVEAAIDFPEEEIDFLSDDRLMQLLTNAQSQMTELHQQTKQGALLREGLSVVLVGEPNAGKSSLMNQFVGNDISIVTDIPGTTRDLVRETISLEGVPLRITDTAGIRDAQNAVEQEGVKRAKAEMETADAVIVVIDVAANSNWRDQVQSLLSGFESIPIVFVALNKIDIAQDQAGISNTEPYLVVPISATSGQGIQQLKATMLGQLAPNMTSENNFIARSRHVDALNRAESHLSKGRSVLLEDMAGELFAEELRYCHEALIEITGEYTSDDLLGEIFSSFCIGK